MTTVVLQSVGATLGAAIAGPVGAIVGRAAGALAGSAIDQKLFSKDRVIEGPRLEGTRVLTSSEGTPIPRVYGRNRIAGQIIWATSFEETVTRSGGAGKGTGASSPKTTEYNYFANFAIGICVGPVSCLRRVWADGKELDLTKLEYRFYTGSEDQEPDPLIEAKQGSGNAPGYRGTAYIVFETFPLADYGNRIPQLSFEIVRSIGKLEKDIRSITIIPGSTEYGYSPTNIAQGGGQTQFRSYNRHTNIAATDWQASIDELQAVCSNLETVSLVVAWFGNDLRAEQCNILPGVTSVFGANWNVAGRSRHQAHVVSQINGLGAFGGTPSDASVTAAIADLKARGLKVVLYPFIMMDIPQGNSLPSPYGGASQPVYPWRGDITCFPAPGEAGTVDKTAVARTQINAFANGSLGSYRAMILHYANLCASAGGVDGFLIGSELRALTRVRDQNGDFPFVETLIDLAGDCRAILGGSTTITYAADWSEYFGYQPADGSGDVIFNLDPLWMSADIDAIGIDNYMPVADWRDAGDPHDDTQKSSHSLDYFKSNIARGEGYDWYYASSEDREAGTRTPITDGLGEPWIYRFKDLQSWWSNPHHNRHGGVRSATPTEWVPEAKPFHFTELGCPAVDKGPNQPNVFFDPKSDQSALPYFSSGGRDDLVQRRFLEAHFKFWSDAANNPVSSVYAGPMVTVDEISLWSWDARPFPWFPLDEEIWSDGENWHRAHWLNGRLGACPAQDLIEQILTDYGYELSDTAVDGYLDGYVIPSEASVRTVLEPILNLFNILAVEEGGKIKFYNSAYSKTEAVPVSEIIQEGDEPQKTLLRGSELELPAEVVISHGSLFNRYEGSGTKSRRLEGGSDRQVLLSLPVVMDESNAIQVAEKKLRDAWQGRDECRVALSIKNIGISVGDIISFDNETDRTWLVESVETGARQDLVLRSVNNYPSVSRDLAIPQYALPKTVLFGAPDAFVLDLPLLRSADASRHISHVAISAEPWAGSYAIFTSPSEDGFIFRAAQNREAGIGTLTQPVGLARHGIWDRGNRIRISLASGSLQSAAETSVLIGANTALLLAASGEYEIIQFATAELQGDGTWELSDLLRGQFDTNDLSVSEFAIDAQFILLDDAILPVELETQEVGIQQNWRIGPARDAVASESYEQISHANGGRSRVMLSPAHLRAVETADGLSINWIRRGRIDSDNWDAAEIPLDAATELYELRLLDSEGSIQHQQQISTAHYEYSNADRITDFGSGEVFIEIQVAQIGDNGLPGHFTRLSGTFS